jgi:hypothetical protein
MHTYPITDKDRTIFATEIDNVYVTLGVIARILEGITEVSSVRKRKTFSSSSDTHLTFLFRGRPFIVVEPYGDNSRYWIGPEDTDREHLEISAIDEAFKRYIIPPFAKIAGDLVSLRFLTAFRR